jgi:hypothetical protein
MLKWVLIVVGVLVACAALGNLGYSYLPRRRLRKFLSDRGVDFVRIKSRPSYGWPGYVVVFESIERSSGFRGSKIFEALLREVQSMHANLRHGAARFDVNTAVALEPINLPYEVHSATWRIKLR